MKGVEEDWLGARNYCRQRCMDSVSLETSNENEWIKRRLVDEKVLVLKMLKKKTKQQTIYTFVVVVSLNNAYLTNGTLHHSFI